MMAAPTDALIVIDPQLDFCPGGALAVTDGDTIRVDIAGRTIDLQVDETELKARRASPDWQPLPPYVTTGVLGKYAKLVRSAAEGAYCG